MFRRKLDKRKLVQAAVAVALVATALVTPLQAWRSARASEQRALTPTPEVRQTETVGSEQAEPTATPAERRETRAVWVSRWDFAEHSDVQEIVDNVSRAHMNVIFFQVRGQADALYRPGLEPWAADLSGTLGEDPGYDPLADLIAAAHAKDIEVHAWMNTFPAWMGDTPPAESATPRPMYHEFNERFGDEWLQWKGDQPMKLGEEGYLWGNPAHPAVADRVVEVSKDLLHRYELDGLHLDYIRYAGREISQDPVSNRAYAEAAAKNPGLTREDWQRDQVTEMVRRVHDEALPERPNARLTTSAWPVYKDQWGWYKGNDGYSAFYQDSQRWAREGYVSAIVPMTYGMTLDGHIDRFEVLAHDYVDGSQPGGVVLGVGADYADFAELARRVEITREAGAKGQSFFSYRALAEHDHWAALGDGPYQEAAAPNWQ